MSVPIARRRRSWILVMGMAALVMLAALSPTLMGYWLFRQFPKKVGLKVEGTFVPHGLRPRFEIRDIYVDWKRRVEVSRGELNVSFDPFFWMKGVIRLQVSGSDLPLRFGEDWMGQAGIPEVTVRRFYVDLAFDSQGLRQVYALEAKSPQFHFQIQ